MSEIVLLSYKKISTLIPKIMNYKFGVGVGGEELLGLISIFYDLNSQNYEFQNSAGVGAGYFSLQYLTKVYLQNFVYNFYTLLFLNYHERCS